MTFALMSKSKTKQAASGKRAVKAKPLPIRRAANLPPMFKIHSSIPTPTIQTKLKIGEPNDKYEQEADRVADEVMRMPDSEVMGAAASKPLTQKTSPFVQRMCEKCAEEEKETLRRKPIQETSSPLRISGLNASIVARFSLPKETALIQRQEMEEEETLQTKSTTGATPEITPGIEAGIQSFKGSGQPLSFSERAFFESRFARDFSQIRIHTDTRAAALAHALNARAFTVGRDIVFGARQYAPASKIGRKLLAHELTHSIQQSHGVLIQRYPSISSWSFNSNGDRLSSDNSCHVCQDKYFVQKLGVNSTFWKIHMAGSRLLSNGMELKAYITGHEPTATYDIKRIKQSNLWDNSGANTSWKLKIKETGDDDPEDTDEMLDPKTEPQTQPPPNYQGVPDLRYWIYAIDHPGFLPYYSDAPQSKIAATATAAVKKSSFTESVEITFDGKKKKDPKTFDWHSILWANKSGSNWTVDENKSEIAPGSISVDAPN